MVSASGIPPSLAPPLGLRPHMPRGWQVHSGPGWYSGSRPPLKDTRTRGLRLPLPTPTEVSPPASLTSIPKSRPSRQAVPCPTLRLPSQGRPESPSPEDLDLTGHLLSDPGWPQNLRSVLTVSCHYAAVSSQMDTLPSKYPHTPVPRPQTG